MQVLFFYLKIILYQTEKYFFYLTNKNFHILNFFISFNVFLEKKIVFFDKKKKKKLVKH